MLFLSQAWFNDVPNFNWEQALPDHLFERLSKIGVDCLPIQPLGFEGQILSIQGQLRAKIADATGMITELEKVKDADFFPGPYHPIYNFLCGMLDLEIEVLYVLIRETWKILSGFISVGKMAVELQEVMLNMADSARKGEHRKTASLRREFIAKLQQQG